MSSRTPATRRDMRRAGGGAIRPMKRRTSSWRFDGGVWPSFSAAAFRSSGAALGERERRLGHAPQLQALLRAGGGDRGAEVLARALGVVALGGARAEDRLGGGAEAGLGLELLVGAGLEPLHGGHRGLLLDADLPLLGRHDVSVRPRGGSRWARGRGRAGSRAGPGAGVELVLAGRRDVVRRVGVEQRGEQLDLPAARRRARTGRRRRRRSRARRRSRRSRTARAAGRSATA